MALFFLLAVASIVGTLVPQNLSPDQYAGAYGAIASRLFQAAGITDLYHAWWFVSLLGLLVLNLTACSLHRLPPTWRAVRARQRPLTDGLWSSLAVRRALEGDGTPEVILGEIRRGLRRHGWSVREEREGVDLHLMAQRGRCGRMGVFVTHLGVIWILLGAAIGFLWGFKGFVQIHEGQTVEQAQDRKGGGLRPLGFGVRCERFEMTSYPDGTPREYRSDLAFVQGGRVVQQGAIRVNHPMDFGGFTFYQSSYGSSARVTLDAADGSGAPGRRLSLELGEIAGLDPQGRILVRPLRFEPDAQGRGPAVLVAVLEIGGRPAGGWLRKGDRSNPVAGWTVGFVDATESRWTGIQVKRDPGTWVVWVGFILVMAGCAVAFGLSHRRLWIRARRVGGRTICHVAASTHRGRPVLNAGLDDLCRQWERMARLRPAQEGGVDG